MRAMRIHIIISMTHRNARYNSHMFNLDIAGRGTFASRRLMSDGVLGGGGGDTCATAALITYTRETLRRKVQEI